MNTSLLILLLSVATLVSAGCSKDSDCPIGPCIFGRCVLSKHHDLMARPCDTKWDCSFFEVCVMGLCVGKSNLHEEENALALQTNSLKRCSSSSDCPFNAPCIFGRCSISKKHDLVAGNCICPNGVPCSVFGGCITNIPTLNNPVTTSHNLVPKSCNTKWDCSFFEVCVMGFCVGKSKHHEEENALQTTNSLKECSSSSDCPFGFLCLFGRCVISKKHNLMAKGCDTKWDCSLLEVCVMGFCVGKSNLHEEENVLALHTNSLKQCSSSSDCPFGAPCIFGTCSISKKHNLMPKNCNNKWDCKFTEACVMGFCVGI